MTTHFKNAQQFMPGGVNSPVRSPLSLNLSSPIYFTHARNAYIYEQDTPYIDYQNGFGATILGHQHPVIQEALQQAIDSGLPGGICHEGEVKLAQLIRKAIPQAEKMRFCVTGTESCMTALRLAQHVTGRQSFITFEGCYHGHGDHLLKKSPQHHCVPYNDVTKLIQCFQEHGAQIAALFVEPIAGNMGMIKPGPDFLQTCERLCREHNALLIADEVMTGFRCYYGSVAQTHHITPDLICLAKVIGGGLPLACLAGRAEIMNELAPLGPVTHAGTYASLASCVHTGIATLSHLSDKHYRQLNEYTEQLTSGMTYITKKYGLPLQTCHQGGMWSFFFSKKPVKSQSDIPACHHQIFKLFYPLMIENNIFLPPNSLESCFVTCAHKQEHLGLTLTAFEKSFKQLTTQHKEYLNRLKTTPENKEEHAV